MPALDRSLIAGLRPFLALSSEELDEILSAARSARYARDTEIFAQGAEATHFFLLLSGHIRVVQTSPEGHQVVARYINEGELFGIAVAMSLKAYPATVVAAVDCVALSWPNSVWPNIQTRFPGFANGVYQTIGSHLRDTQTRVMELSSAQVEQRVANAVLRLAKQSGRKPPKGSRSIFPLRGRRSPN